jgi:two-component system cell cycle sensor histidine kinase PleC
MWGAMTGSPSAVRPRDAPTGVRRYLTVGRQMVLLGGLAIACIVGVAVGFIVHLHDLASAASRKEMSNLAGVLAEQTARTFQGVELVLAAIEEQISRLTSDNRLGLLPLHLMLNDRIADIPQIKQVTIIGPDGHAMASSRFYPTLGLSLADRPYFIAHRDNPGRALLITGPFQSRVDGEWLIIVSRRVETPDGAFAGAIAVGLNPGYFEGVYRTAAGGEGMAIALLRNEGTVLARQPRPEGIIGTRMFDGALLARSSEAMSNGDLRVTSRIDGQVRALTVKNVPGYPLIIAPSIREADIFIGWRHEALLIGIAAAVAATAILALLIFVWISEERTRRHAAQLAMLVEKFNTARLEAERARATADEANRAKSLFLANMSHELRTPLNAILGFSELIEQAVIGPLDSRYRDYAHDVRNSGEYLLRLINDLLDTSKIEVGRLDLREDPVDLGEVARECQRLLLDKAHDAYVELAIDLPPDMPMLLADRLRMKQILLNLLSNALKFTPAGGQVKLTATLMPQEDLELKVTDTGIGMRPEDVSVALEPFRQLDNLMSRRYEGTGLGLPLAKALTELHGGSFEVASHPGKGTVVRVLLPKRRVIPLGNISESGAPTHGSSRNTGT